MHWIELAVQAICIALEVGVIVCLSRWGGWREVPVFLAYLVFILLRTIVGSIALSHEAFYFEFYWISAPLEIGLTVLAVLESFWRVFACSSCVFCRILSNVITDGSVGWFCQIVLGSFSEESSRMAASFPKPPRQDVLDPVYPHGHISRRQACDFSNRRRVHVFEIGDDDLAVERLELLN